jgi:hypothetical protein
MASGLEVNEVTAGAEQLPGASEPAATEFADRLRRLAVRILPKMYCPREHLFVHHLQRYPTGVAPEGTSVRYTATVLIALADMPEDVGRGILAGQSPDDVCDLLLRGIGQSQDAGEVALVLWAAAAIGHPNLSSAAERLAAMFSGGNVFPTVELAWALTALSAAGPDSGREGIRGRIAVELLSRFREESGLFACSSIAARQARAHFLGHVACFADQVYPIQALSEYHRTTGWNEALEAASRCARKICELQSPEGQWWWHYDVRTGRIVERYPVYSVHQDAMAPMALFALRDAGGPDHVDAVARGLQWLANPPEIDVPLIDWEQDLIWRKVARREPGKLTRGLQAVASRVHPRLRAPLVDHIFPPDAVDYETRPYHMGWILYAWCERRTRALWEGSPTPIGA